MLTEKYEILHYFLISFPAKQDNINTITSAHTIVAPAGVAKIIEAKMPAREQITAITAAQIVTLLKLLNMRIAERAGKIMSAEMRSAPTRFIAITITIAVMIARAKL